MLETRRLLQILLSGLCLVAVEPAWSAELQGDPPTSAPSETVVKETSLRWRGDVFAYGQAIAPQATPLNPGGVLFAVPRRHGLVGGSLGFDWVSGGALSATATVVAISHPAPDQQDLRISDLDLSLTTSSRNASVSLGVREFAWSVSEVFHTLDLFSPSQRHVAEIDPGLEMARPFARVAGAVAGGRLELLAVAEEDDRIDSDRLHLVLRYDGDLGPSHAQLILDRQPSGAGRLGLSIDAPLNDRSLIWAEVLVSSERDLILLRPATVLPFTTIGEDPRRGFVKLVLGGRYRAAGLGQLEASLFYNQHGYDDQEWSRMRQVIAQSARDLTIVPQNGFALGAGARQLRDHWQRREYANLGWNSMTDLDPLQLGIGVLAGLDDGSATLYSTGKLELPGSVTVAIRLSGWTRGDGDELADAPAGGSAALRLTKSF